MKPETGGSSFAQLLEGQHDKEAASRESQDAPLERRLEGFKKSACDRGEDRHCYFEDADGEHRHWGELSPAGRLAYMVRDAVFFDVPFEAFASAARDNIGADTLLDASLRVAFSHVKELTNIARLLPDDGRTEPTPLVDQVRDVMAALEHSESLIHGQPDQEIER